MTSWLTLLLYASLGPASGSKDPLSRVAPVRRSNGLQIDSLPCSDVICDLLLNRSKATWNLSIIKYS